MPPKLAGRRPPKRGWLLLLLALSAFVLFTRFSYREERRPAAPPVWSPNPQRPREGPRRIEGLPPKPIKPAAAKKITGPRAAPPEFATPGGVYAEELAVELKVKAAGATVRYTLDGSEPTAGSHEYAGPIAISDTTLVRAAAFESGLAPSPTVSQTYTILDPSLAGFSSNLPLIIINTFGQQISKEQTASASLRIIPAGQKRSTWTSLNDFDGRCEIKLRGYSSLRAPKHSFTIKTRTDAGESLAASILGLPKGSDWVLYAPYSDKTLMRDVLAYELSNQMGRYAARTRFVEVFLSRSGSKLGKRDYAGVYVFEEKIKRGKDRVNIQKLTPEDNSEPNITGGYIFKRDHPNSPMEGPFGFFGQNPSYSPGEEAGFMTGHGLHLFYVDPKEREMTAAQKTYLSRYMSQLEKAIYGPGFRSPTEGYAQFLDVDSFIDQFWIVELSKNIDGFRYSCYMFKDRGGKLRVEPIWDWNLSFGNANYHEGWMPENWYWPLLRENEVSWFKRLSKDPNFVQRVNHRWTELRRTIFAPESILARIDEMAKELGEAQARNFQRWPILGQPVNPNFFIGESYTEEVDWMKNWIQERIAWIDNQVRAGNAYSSATLAPPRSDRPARR